jgi:hypothetical protein
MKNGLCSALVCLAIISACAKNAASQDLHASGETTITFVQDYADRVNGLLRDVHVTLQTITERMEARTLTPQQAQKQKLAATRAMIARLETLSAVYDGKIAGVGSAPDRYRCTPESGGSNDAAAQGMRSKLTLKELESTVSRAAGQ